MLQPRITSTMSLRSLPLLAILVLAPALARADDMGFSGGSGCDDPPIFSDIFELPPTNATGGMCRAFGNFTGGPITSLKFTTTIPDPNADPMTCSPAPFFATCDFVVDTLDDTITVEFFGNIDHPGIPVIPPGGRVVDNFFINLNKPVCDPLTGLCTQPADANGTGDWLLGGQPEIFIAEANGAPEPAAWMLLLGGISALLARARVKRTSRAR
jgi:hypothetical protein